MIGTWVVLRGLTFLGDALAHGVVPGLALAVLWGFSLTLGALVAALLMSGAVTLVSHRTRVREDTGIGLLFVGMLALGVIISRSESFATDVTALLFGDILGVTTGDLRGCGLAAAVVVAVSVALFRPFMALTFNADKAATLGMRPVAAHAALMVLLAVSIVASFDAIGTLLVFGLLIGPPATAGCWSGGCPKHGDGGGPRRPGGRAGPGHQLPLRDRRRGYHRRTGRGPVLRGPGGPGSPAGVAPPGPAAGHLTDPRFLLRFWWPEQPIPRQVPQPPPVALAVVDEDVAVDGGTHPPSPCTLIRS